MSEREKFSYETQCQGKIRYEDKAEAKIAAKKSEQRFGRLRPYECPHCGTADKPIFHLGHRPRSKK